MISLGWFSGEPDLRSNPAALRIVHVHNITSGTCTRIILILGLIGGAKKAGTVVGAMILCVPNAVILARGVQSGVPSRIRGSDRLGILVDDQFYYPATW